MAVIELDKNDKPLSDITLYKVNSDGSLNGCLIEQTGNMGYVHPL